MKKTLVITLATFVVALLDGSVMAQTDGDVRFGIRPTEAFEDRPETFSYFSHELALGAVLSDAALVVNSGFVPVSLNMYAADGITAVNTGTAFSRKGQDALGHSRGTRQWLSFSDTEFRLEGAEELTVPFTITVPPDALPGHHVAGLVVEAPPDGNASVGEDEGQFAAIVVQQAAVAVVIDVPGPHIAGLEITSTCMKTQGDLGATFVVGVHNTGNILLKGEGALSLMDHEGTELASVPLEMGTVLPGDTTTFQVDHPVSLGDGEYLLSDVLNYEGKTATLEEIEFKVKDGQPEVGCDPEEDAEPPASFIDIISPLGGGGSSLVRIAIFGGAALALALIMLALIRRRRARGAGPEQPSAPRPPSSSAGGSDGNPGEAQPTKAIERTSERRSFTRLILALIRRPRAEASDPEQPSPPRPSFNSIGGSDGTPREAPPQEGDPHPEAKMPSPAAFAPPVRPAKSDQHPPEAERPSRPNVTPPPQPAEADQKPDIEESTVAEVTPAPQPPEREQAPEAEKLSPAEVTAPPEPAEADQKPDIEEPTVAEVTPAPQPPEREQAPEAEKLSAVEGTPPPEPVKGGDELPAFLLKQLGRSSSPPPTTPAEDSASSETAAEEQQEEKSAA